MENFIIGCRQFLLIFFFQSNLKVTMFVLLKGQQDLGNSINPSYFGRFIHVNACNMYHYILAYHFISYMSP